VPLRGRVPASACPRAASGTVGPCGTFIRSPTGDRAGARAPMGASRRAALGRPQRLPPGVARAASGARPTGLAGAVACRAGIRLNGQRGAHHGQAPPDPHGHLGNCKPDTAEYERRGDRAAAERMHAPLHTRRIPACARLSLRVHASKRGAAPSSELWASGTNLSVADNHSELWSVVTLPRSSAPPQFGPGRPSPGSVSRGGWL
jgi:hypothetical protein